MCHQPTHCRCRCPGSSLRLGQEGAGQGGQARAERVLTVPGGMCNMFRVAARDARDRPGRPRRIRRTDLLETPERSPLSGARRLGARGRVRYAGGAVQGGDERSSRPTAPNPVDPRLLLPKKIPPMCGGKAIWESGEDEDKLRRSPRGKREIASTERQKIFDTVSGCWCLVAGLLFENSIVCHVC